MLIFYVTFPNESAARETAANLLQTRLIACANIFPVSANFCWNNAVCNENEWVALLKTRTVLEEQVEIALQKAHPYEIPCIIRWEARVNAAYETWINENTLPAA